MIYLATPYTHDDAAVERQRYQRACELAAHLTVGGHVVFSPIVHGHAMRVATWLQLDRAHWMEIDFEFLRRSDALVIAKMPGWETSLGVQDEIAYASTHGIPIYFWTID